MMIATGTPVKFFTAGVAESATGAAPGADADGAAPADGATPGETEPAPDDEPPVAVCVSPATVRDWLYKRRLASVKIGGRVCIRRADLEALVTVRPARVWTLDGQ